MMVADRDGDIGRKPAGGAQAAPARYGEEGVPERPAESRSNGRHRQPDGHDPRPAEAAVPDAWETDASETGAWEAGEPDRGEPDPRWRIPRPRAVPPEPEAYGSEAHARPEPAAARDDRTTEPPGGAQMAARRPAPPRAYPPPPSTPHPSTPQPSTPRAAPPQPATPQPAEGPPRRVAAAPAGTPQARPEQAERDDGRRRARLDSADEAWLAALAAPEPEEHEPWSAGPSSREDRRVSAERTERTDRAGRADRTGSAAPMEQTERTDRTERTERPERAERAQPADRAERAERAQPRDRALRAERAQPTDRADQAERAQPADRAHGDGHRDGGTAASDRAGDDAHLGWTAAGAGDADWLAGPTRALAAADTTVAGRQRQPAAGAGAGAGAADPGPWRPSAPEDDRGATEGESAAAPVVAVLRALADADVRASGRGTVLARAVRALTLGLVDPGAIEALDLERDLVASVCAPQRRARVVAVVSGHGGAGTTTTAAGIALTLAALRQDATVLADARAGTGSITNRLAGRVGPGLRQVADGPRSALPFVGGGGLRTVDGAPPSEPLGAGEMRAAVDELTVTHTFTLLDVGNDLSPAGQEAVRLADQVVVVTTASDEGLRSAQVVLDRIGDREGDAWVSTVFAVVRMRPESDGRAHRRLRRLTEGSAEAALIPHDRYLSSGGRIEPSRLRPATRQAYLALAALVAGAGA
ncbi:hypothetical protein ABZS66_54730 [Dactylosporangium sp. NPDC005572]|uniref:hypothetical protein n=1 Tax=Dactylosporangium sp. NPDC005572 TaxID=3156889 RepID=UPI00339ED573